VVSSQSYDFSGISDDAVEDMLHLGQECLSGTVQLALAADQRATALAGMFGGGFVALLATAAAVLTSEHLEISLFVACLTSAVGFFLAAVLCAWAAKPTDFYVGGYEPKLLAKSAEQPVWMKRYATEDMQRRIDSNRLCLVAASRKVAWGAIIAFLAPLSGFAVFLFTRQFF
jgi:hypothetical protein